MCWNWASFGNDISILFPQIVASVRVNLQVDRLQLLPQILDLLPEIRILVVTQPVLGVVGEIVQSGRFVRQIDVLFEEILTLGPDSVTPFDPNVF